MQQQIVLFRKCKMYPVCSVNEAAIGVTMVSSCWVYCMSYQT